VEETDLKSFGSIARPKSNRFCDGEKQVKGRQKGFTLIELLIVVAIILIIAAISVGYLLRAKQAAVESRAVADVQAIFKSANIFSNRYTNIGYPNLLTDMGDGGVSPCVPTSTAACLLDSVLASGIKGGYAFTYTPVNLGAGTINTSFTVTATPNDSSGRFYYMDASGVTRWADATPATVTSNPI